MTPLSGGQVIRGHLITAHDWTNHLENLLQVVDVDGQQDAELQGQWAQAFDDWDAERDELSENRVAAGLPDPESRFIHMRNVTIGSANATKGVQVPTWRGLVDSIDGWSIGGV